MVTFPKERYRCDPWKSYAFSEKEKTWLYEIAREKDVVLDLFVRPYAMLNIYTTANIEGIIHSLLKVEIVKGSKLFVNINIES